jgi:hypothetical protein
MAKKAKKKTVDEIGKAVGRIRDELASHNVSDDLKSLRTEVENLARRVAALEVPGRSSSSSRSTAARKPAAARSTTARKPAASRSTAAKKPATTTRSRSTAAKKPATTTRSRSTSTRSSS